MNLAIVTLPWTLGNRDSGHGRGTTEIVNAGLQELLGQRGHSVAACESAELSQDEARKYGAWHKSGLANGHLADLIAAQRRENRFVVALESDCTGSIGALGGLQRAGAGRLGMVWIDAHADFNTTETTLSGMLGGMPVAVAAGLCLNRLRMESGLTEPIAPENVVMVGLRDVDREEMALLEEHHVPMVPANPEAVRAAVEALGERVDAIYVHTDWDVLDPRDIPTAGLPVPNGPRLQELARVVQAAATHPKTVMAGFAAYNADRDPERSVARNLAKVIADAL